MAHKVANGGSATHKDPMHCNCAMHKSQRRKAEAFALSVGVGGAPLTPNKPNWPSRIKNPSHGTLEVDMTPLFLQGKTGRDRIIQWMSFRAAEPGITNKEVAKRLGLSARTLNTLISKAARQGWLKFEEPMERIEHEIIPKAIQNLSEFLDQKDHQATLETLKGTAFPVYRESKGAGDSSNTVLALRIETADPSDVKVLTGNIVGTPRELTPIEVKIV